MDEVSPIVLPTEPPPASAVQKPVSQLAEEAMVDLMAWREKHLLNSPFSRDTACHNRIHDALSEVRSALTSCKE